jgi:signal transduction histidine kinase
VTENTWTRWPSREALGRDGVTRPRRLLAWTVRLLALGVLVWGTLGAHHIGGWGKIATAGGVLVTVILFWGFYHSTYRHRLWSSLLLITLLLSTAELAEASGFRGPALIVWCSCAIAALERLPLGAGLPAAAVALAAFSAINNDVWLTTAAVVTGMALAGYVMRLDAEARGSAQRLLAQERAARAAEAETAALAERARIAREIHDVLAHSLSAQMVHLEAARLLIERDADREQILERVVAARGMARDGLAEIRQALSALRGEMTPLEDFLSDLVRASDGAEVTVTGDRRPLPAEAAQAVRRVAQEALTNARKHAYGARIRVRLEYDEHEVRLDVNDSGGKPGDLTTAGGGYGLLGMRERAELLGGSLEAGPDKEGFAVRLKVPV